MKDFFERHSYNAVKLLLNQIVIGIFFGVGFLFVANKMESPAFKIAASVISIIFYLFLEFTVAYKLGADDRVSVDLGKTKPDYLLPVKLWLLANSINLLLAVFIALGQIFSSVGFFGSIGGVCVTIAMIIEGMYVGLLLLLPHWSMYFLITLPALAVIFISYVVGLKSKKIAKMFEFQYPESDRPEQKPKKK